jgi:hypothetical protein
MFTSENQHWQDPGTERDLMVEEKSNDTRKLAVPDPSEEEDRDMSLEEKIEKTNWKMFELLR